MSDGTFVFTTTRRIDHRIVARSGDGHQAEFTIRADELAGLPVPSLVANPSAISPRMSADNASPRAAVEIEAIIAEAVARQVRPLREQLDVFKNEVRLRDVLGGIGYIFGITGVAFYILGRKRENTKMAGREKPGSCPFRRDPLISSAPKETI